MRSLPGESASRDRVVSRPYATAQAAQTRATTTPWFVRKLLNRNPPRSDLRAARGCSRAHLPPGPLSASAYPVQTRAQSIVPAGECPRRRAGTRRSAAGHPQPAARLRRPGRVRAPRAWGCFAGARRPRRLAASPARRPARAARLAPAAARLHLARVGHLQLRERVAQRPQLLRDRCARGSRAAPGRASIASRTCSRSRCRRRAAAAPPRRASAGGPSRRAAMFSSDTAAWAIMSVP